MIITRKIQLNFNVAKEELKKEYEKIFGWQRIVHRAANFIATHFYLQDQIKELFYVTDDTKVKLSSINKDPEGIFKTSRDNTTYQLLSKKFKGECPMGMLSGLNQVVTRSYKAEKSEIWKGLKSLRSYKQSVPMPVRSADINHWQKQEDGNYTFNVYGTSFKTYFGRDLSGNETILDRISKGEYKLSDSSIKLQRKNGKWRIFLLCCINLPSNKIILDKNKTALCCLDYEYPIIIKEKKDFYNIGTKEEYLHGRMAIRGALRRVQINSQYNNGGKGRKKKLKPMEYFKEAEKRYVENKMHNYSRKLIDYCLKHSIGNIVLSNYEDVVKKTHEENDESKLLLSSWSYFSLSEKIKYKAAREGIEVALKKGAEVSEKVL